MGRGFSCPSGHVTNPPPNTADSFVPARAPRPRSVTPFVPWTGSGLDGPTGGSARLPASIKARPPSGPAPAPALTPPLRPAPLAKAAVVTHVRCRTATACPTAPVRLPRLLLPQILRRLDSVHNVHRVSASVDGGWSAWTSFSSCPVTCGVGLQVSDRKCNSPPAQHGGRPCPGQQRRSKTCQTNVHCPGTRQAPVELESKQSVLLKCPPALVCAVDGVWASWSEWTPCKSPFGSRDIRCLEVRGSQKRIRECLHRAHNGSICSGDQLSQIRVCYDVNRCYRR